KNQVLHCGGDAAEWVQWNRSFELQRSRILLLFEPGYNCRLGHFNAVWTPTSGRLGWSDADRNERQHCEDPRFDGHCFSPSAGALHGKTVPIEVELPPHTTAAGDELRGCLKSPSVWYDAGLWETMSRTIPTSRTGLGLWLHLYCLRLGPAV